MSLKLLSLQKYSTRSFGTASVLRGSVLFSGSSSGYIVPSAATSATNFGTSDFTVEFFYRPLADGQQNCIDNIGIAGVSLYRSPSTKVLNYYVGGDRITSSTVMNNGGWYHIALVRSSGTSRLYVNGTKEGVDYTDSNNFTGSATYPTIGAGGSGGIVPVNGHLSNLRIVKSAVYTANFTTPASALTAISGTSLLTCQNPLSITDNGPNTFSMTIFGDAAPSSVSPFA